MPKIKTGTKEWAVANVNIQIGCEHNCRYCYARAMAVRRFRRCTAEQWTKPVIDYSKVAVNRRHINGIVMFPSSHDITPSNISECLCVLHRLLDAGNQVLIVSKPHWDCITKKGNRSIGYFVFGKLPSTSWTCWITSLLSCPACPFFAKEAKDG